MKIAVRWLVGDGYEPIGVHVLTTHIDLESLWADDMTAQDLFAEIETEVQLEFERRVRPEISNDKEVESAVRRFVAEKEQR